MYGTLTVKTQIGASGATGINTQFHNDGTATLNCTMEAGSIHSHEGATTIFDGGTYHFTCVENMRNGLKFVSGTFNDLRKVNGQTQWTDDEFNGGLDVAAKTTLNQPNIPGGKKLIYTHINMPLTAISDFKELGKRNSCYAALAEITKDHRGLWWPDAEEYLLQHWPNR